jgi:hypothetical protein
VSYAKFELVARAVIGVSLLVAVIALLWPPTVPKAAQTPPEAASRGTASTLRHKSADNNLIAQANIFSAVREAPKVRYVPYGYETDSDEVPQKATTQPPAQRAAAPILFGTVMGDRPGALMSLDPAVPGAQMYHEGDRAGGYRVVRIGERAVTLTGPAGQIVLQLNRAEGQTP